MITARELLTLATDRGIRLNNLPLRPIPAADRASFSDEVTEPFLFPPPRKRQRQIKEAGTSGGYLSHVLASQQEMYPGSQMTTSRGRNADVVEYTLTSATGQPLFNAAQYYGFRNIQNLVRKLKPAKSSKLPGAAGRRMAEKSGIDFQYVEVMACPGGCTNGGGQIKVEDVQSLAQDQVERQLPQTQKEWQGLVDEAYYSAGSIEDSEERDEMDMDATEKTATDVLNGINVGEVRHLLQHWADVVGVPLQKLVYTTYRAVESDIGKSKGRKMGDSERIATIAGSHGGGW